MRGFCCRIPYNRDGLIYEYLFTNLTPIQLFGTGFRPWIRTISAEPMKHRNGYGIWLVEVGGVRVWLCPGGVRVAYGSTLIQSD